MLNDAIYTPRASIDMLLMRPTERNKQTCTRIPYKGYEISIAMDSSHGKGDLHRSDVRIYNGNDDITKVLLPDYESDVPACAATLKECFAAIDKVTAEQSLSE